MVEPVTTAVAVASLFAAPKLIEFALGGIVGDLTSSVAATSLALVKRLIKQDGRPANHDVARSIHTAFVRSMQAIVVDAQSAPKDAQDRFSLEALRDLVKSDEITVWNAENVQIPFEQLEQSISQIYGRQGVSGKHAATDQLIAFLEQRLPVALTPVIAGVFRNGHKGQSWADLFELFFSEEVKTNDRVFRIQVFDGINELRDRTNALLRIAEEQATQIAQLQLTIAEFFPLLLGAIVSEGDKTRAAVAEVGKAISADAPLVIGITRFSAVTAAPGSFRAYLESGQLPYCSRADFAVRHGIANQFEFDELAMLAYLESGPHQVLVLSGPGGVGKTRLSLELGRRLLENEDRSVAILSASTRGQDVERFVRSEKQNKFAFILDYGETASNLDDLIQTIDALADQAGAEVALIITCRDSASEKVFGSVSQLDNKVLSLSAEAGNVAKYQEWLTFSILAHIPEADRGALAATCRSVPALAAFALFLYRSYPALFDEQFRRLGATDDFSGWIERRANVLIQQAKSSGGALAELALSLPMPLAFRDMLIDRDDEKSRLLRALEADRWVEPEGGQLVPAHDVLADGLAARWLLGLPNQVTTRVGEALRRAFSEGRFGTALQVLDRLAFHTSFNQLNGAAVLTALRRQPGFYDADYFGEFLGGRLLDPDEKIDLLLSDPEYSDVVFADPSLRLALTAAIEDLTDWSEVDGRGLSAERNALLFPILDRIANATDTPSNMPIRRLYHFAPDRYREQALNNIDRFATIKQTHFLLAEMLRMGEPLEVMAGRVSKWLEEHGGDVDRASYVYEAWLDRKGDGEFLKCKMLQWLLQFGLKEDAGFVLKSWLRATRDIGTVEKFLQPWLEKFGTYPSSSHVLEYYARCDNLGEQSRKYINVYLSECAEDRMAGLVYAAWLDLNETDNSLDKQINKYLSIHRNFPQLSTVLSRWIQTRGSTAENLEHMNA